MWYLEENDAKFGTIFEVTRIQEKARIANIESNTHEIQEPNQSCETMQATDETKNLKDSRVECKRMVSKHVEIQDSSVKDVVDDKKENPN